MPCYVEPTKEEIEYIEKCKMENLLKEFTHNSPVAEMLCELMKICEDWGFYNGHGGDYRPSRTEPEDILPENILKWWEEHKNRDAKKDLTK